MPRMLMCVAPHELAFHNYEDAALQPGEVRIKAEFGAEKHGTMQAFYKGYANARGAWDKALQLHAAEGMLWEYPLPLGNIVVGTIIEAGSAVTNRQVGERVFTYSGFSETCVSDASACWSLPVGVAWQSAVMLDPAEFAIGAIRDGHVRFGDVVAVFGLGAIGLATVQLLRITGVSRLIAIDPLPARRQLAEKFGADLTLDPTNCDVGLELKLATAKRGPDVIIDFSGSQHALQQAFRGVAYGGTIVAGSFPPPYGAGFDLGAEAHMNLPILVFSRGQSEPNRDYPRWSEARILANCYRLIQQGKLRGEEVVTPIVDFDELLEEYPNIASEPNRCVKLGVRFGK